MGRAPGRCMSRGSIAERRNALSVPGLPFGAYETASRSFGKRPDVTAGSGPGGPAFGLQAVGFRRRLFGVRRVLRGFLALALVALPLAAPAGPDGRVTVTDGDSLVVDGKRVRLFGIDAHELDQSCTRADGAEVACGRWAKAAAEELFAGRHATCRTLKFDRYDRALATCRVGGRDMGEVLLKEGIVAVYPRETLRDYLDFEKEAQLLERGIWAWDSERPLDFRASQRAPVQRQPVPQASGECVIKGNISGSGRIYHLPGQENYDATRINTGKGERWFCSEAEARAAGWRRARR